MLPVADDPGARTSAPMPNADASLYGGNETHGGPLAVDAERPHVERPVRWVFAGMLLASVVNYIDRQTLSVLAVTMQRDLHLSDVRYGAVVQCFLAAYMVMYVVSGRLVDRFGARWTQAAFLLAWSAADACTGLATGAVSLCLSRVALGAAEPGNFTASLRAAGDWSLPGSAPSRWACTAWVERSALRFAVPLAAGLAGRYGWRMTFFATGAVGVLLALLWTIVYRDPPNKTEKAQGAPWPVVLRQPYILPLLLTRMMTDSVWYFFLFWNVKYLQESHRLLETGLDQSTWTKVAQVEGNYQRHRKLRLPQPATARALRMVIEGTNGDPSAAVYEIRVY